jgi:hypothetical protein
MVPNSPDLGAVKGGQETCLKITHARGKANVAARASTASLRIESKRPEIENICDSGHCHNHGQPSQVADGEADAHANHRAANSWRA